MTDRKDDLADRLGDRFDGDRGGDGKNEENDIHAGNAWNVKNVKNAWNGNTVYLPEHLDALLDDEYDRLVYELDRTVKKDRHYKPFVVALGLQQLAELDRSELMERMEQMEREELDLGE